MPPDATLREPLFRVAQELGLALSDAQAASLLGYLDLLGRWSAVYNLTAIRDPHAMLTQHIADCMAVWPPLRRWRGDRRGIRLLDVGSGAGLPGVVLAALDAMLDVTCIDAVGKKMAFVRQAAGELKLPHVHAVHGRVEALEGKPFDIVTSRAFASLSDFVAATGAVLAPGGIWLAMKGKRPDDEIAALPAAVEVFHVEQLSVPGVEGARCLVWMRPRAQSPVQ